MVESDTVVRLPEDKPPAWANSMMRWACTTPGIEKWVGEGVALLSFTGRRTGKHFQIPVGYQRDGDTVTVVTKRIRRWWHNFETPAQVELRLAGKTFTGKADGRHRRCRQPRVHGRISGEAARRRQGLRVEEGRGHQIEDRPDPPLHRGDPDRGPTARVGRTLDRPQWPAWTSPSSTPHGPTSGLQKRSRSPQRSTGSREQPPH